MVQERKLKKKIKSCCANQTSNDQIRIKTTNAVLKNSVLLRYGLTCLIGHSCVIAVTNPFSLRQTVNIYCAL